MHKVTILEHHQAVRLHFCDDANYSYVAFQKVWGQCAFLLYTKLDRLQVISKSDKNVNLRHTYLKATGFSITPGMSCSTMISFLTVLFTVTYS